MFPLTNTCWFYPTVILFPIQENADHLLINSSSEKSLTDEIYNTTADRS